MSNAPSSLMPTDTSTIISEAQPVAPTREFIDVGSITSTDTATSGSPDFKNVPIGSPDFKNVKFKDVIVSDKKSNIVSNNRKKVMTQLYSIMGICTVDITNPQIKVIAKALGIKNCRTAKKIDLCKQIVTWVSDLLNEVVKEISPKMDVNSTINQRRYLNVIFSDVIRPLLATKGASLTKDQLTDGIKQDQILHTKISDKYNKDTPEYASNAFLDIVQGCLSDVGIFDQINWQKSKATFTSLSNEYDKVFYNWKRSGFHGDFPEEEGAEAGTEPHTKKSHLQISYKAIRPCYICTDSCINFQTAFLPLRVSALFFHLYFFSFSYSLLFCVRQIAQRLLP